MKPYTIALFGEAEKGQYRAAYYCDNLEQLANYFGNAPLHSRGLHYAIQALLYRREIIFFRVQEEGFSLPDYYFGAELLQNQHTFSEIAAICVPGAGNEQILKAMEPLCVAYHSLLITSEADLYDYLTRS